MVHVLIFDKINDFLVLEAIQNISITKLEINSEYSKPGGVTVGN